MIVVWVEKMRLSKNYLFYPSMPAYITVPQVPGAVEETKLNGVPVKVILNEDGYTFTVEIDGKIYKNDATIELIDAIESFIMQNGSAPKKEPIRVHPTPLKRGGWVIDR